MISVCDKCTENCKYRRKNLFNCESSNKKMRKIQNDRFKLENYKKEWGNYDAYIKSRQR